MQLLQEEKQQPGFWTFGYYQSFFDVDTSQVRPGSWWDGVQPLFTENFLCTRPWAIAGNRHMGEQPPPRLVDMTGWTACVWPEWDSGTRGAHVTWRTGKGPLEKATDLLGLRQAGRLRVEGSISMFQARGTA